MRTSGAATDTPFVLICLVIGLAILVFVAGGPREVMQGLDRFLTSLAEAVIQLARDLLG